MINIRFYFQGILFLSALCVVAFFSIILGVRFSLPITYQPTCHFRPRAMPSFGLIPFVQTFICNINNDCYEPQADGPPPLDDSKFAKIVGELTPLLKNETFVNVTKTLPGGVRLITTIGDVLDHDDVKKLLGINFITRPSVANLMGNQERIRKSFWSNHHLLQGALGL